MRAIPLFIALFFNDLKIWMTISNSRLRFFIAAAGALGWNVYEVAIFTKALIDIGFMFLWWNIFFWYILNQPSFRPWQNSVRYVPYTNRVWRLGNLKPLDSPEIWSSFFLRIELFKSFSITFINKVYLRIGHMGRIGSATQFFDIFDWFRI